MSHLGMAASFTASLAQLQQEGVTFEYTLGAAARV
jgi:hypothetical protein